ncbi:hypothetical protein HF851_03945 [Corynebacterium ammoniagenes]|uniref:hypothetical protein n=1 Tax=Corynebacterium ammoniagenes TaxID=1697 RepID=UPI0014593551|nr:hypothetical protein [Corynebacterium ammoniagenes]NMF31425.1 hypothetical protein [Corynebacterium ammoniagenes]
MEVKPLSLKDSSYELQDTRKEAEIAAARLKSQVGRDFSVIQGISETGEIHGRAVHNDPASAKNHLVALSGQLEWALEILTEGTLAIESQEESNSLGLDLADSGGLVGESHVVLSPQQNPDYKSLLYTPPVVSVGPSLAALQRNFSSSKLNHLGDLMSDWSDLSHSLQGIADNLNSIASSIEDENDSDFTANASRKIRGMAADAQYFVSNAQQMVGKTGILSMHMPMYNLQMLADVAALKAIPDPLLQKSFEAAALAKWQPTLQNWVTQSLPSQQSFVEAPAASGGGDNIDVGLGAIAGTGMRYNTDEVVWPQEIQQALASGEIGPGSFGVADGELVALENIDQGLVEQVRHAVNERNEALYGGGKLQSFINGGMAPLTDATTQTAGFNSPGLGSLNAGNSPSLGHAGLATAAPSNSGFGTALGTSGGLGNLGAFGGAGGLSSVAAGLPAAGLRGAGLGAGAGLGGLRGTSGISGGRGVSVAGGEAGSRLLNTGGDSGGRAGAAAGTGSGTHSAGAGANGTASQGQHGRGPGAMMAPGAAGRNQEKKKKSSMIKAVMSRVEADKNRRDLVGDPPAALPGPIGDWARQ